jgi:hypothetical protein
MPLFTGRAAGREGIYNGRHWDEETGKPRQLAEVVGWMIQGPGDALGTGEGVAAASVSSMVQSCRPVDMCTGVAGRAGVGAVYCLFYTPATAASALA